MKRLYRQFAILLILCFSASGLVGCSSSGLLSTFSRSDRTDRIPGITLPAERIALLREKGKAASNVTPTQAATISADLAQEYRDQPDPMIRAEAVRAAAFYRTESASTVLSGALQDPDREVRIAACQAWGDRKDAAGVDGLSRTLARDKEAEVQLAATKSLGMIGGSDAVKALGDALENRDPAIQYQAIQALHECTGEDFGNDVRLWRRYVNGDTPESAGSISLTDRAKSFF